MGEIHLTCRKRVVMPKVEETKAMTRRHDKNMSRFVRIEMSLMNMDALKSEEYLQLFRLPPDGVCDFQSFEVSYSNF
ncbi:hypothetical protein HN51_022440 [Arachis hypogaea]|nr:uncharacterized protein DS421_2g50010 [Arachis hypogaea]